MARPTEHPDVCIACKHWVAEEERIDGLPLFGRCHRYPPTLVAISKGGMVHRDTYNEHQSRVDSWSDFSQAWPMVSEGDSCGEFRADGPEPGLVSR